MDAVYVFANKSGDELRHSLRTVGNLRMVDRVVVAGEHPAWLSDDVVRVQALPHPPGKFHDAWANLMGALADPRVSDEFVLMNDDFFVVEPVDELPLWHRGDFETQPRIAGSAMAARRAATLDALSWAGATTSLSYEGHTPMALHRDLMLRAVVPAVAAAWARHRAAPWHRTVYGNLVHGGDAPRMPDVKVHHFDTVPAPGQVFVSTSDYTWRRGAVGRWIRERFAEPCRYEREV